MKICFIGYDPGGLYGRFSGGAEKQIALLARHMAKRGHEVNFVATGYSGPSEIVEGVHLQTGWQPDRGIRGIRFFTYRIPNITKVLREIRADIYYTRGGGFITPTIIAAARRNGSLALLGLASDRDLYVDSGKVLFALGNTRISSLIGPLAYRIFYVRALCEAHCVIAQNVDQASRCKELNIPYKIIPNIVEPASSDLLSLPEESDVAWVGNMSNARRSKGLEVLVSLMKELSQLRFKIIGQIDKTSMNGVLENIKKQYNVVFTGKLTHEETLRVIAGCKLVINTSPSEGFSNVLLEAWSLGKPVVAFQVNPNGLLNPNGLGSCANGDLITMSKAIKYYLKNQDERLSTGRRCLDYAKRVHAPDVVCSQYEALFAEITNHA